ncbi:MAG: ATPase [Candidatus Electrothrix sp. AR1]|nr:ATPase [Candidatus Electrothrix sp. AR1]
MKSMEELDQLKPFQARSIIEELRKGSVPADYVPFFTVGRDNWLTFIEDDLANYIAEGGAKVRFLSGDYGDGKTHFMSVVQHLALQESFGVSFVVLTRETPIHKFEAVYQAITQQLRGRFEGIGIRNLLQQWLDGLAEKEGPSLAQLADMGETLRNLAGMNINFANALTALAHNRFVPLQEGEQQEERDTGRETILHWFEGGKVTKRELKPFGIFEVVNKSNSKQLLNSLNVFLRYLDYKGLILLLDELETVIGQSASVRNAAYENVRLLIDNSEHAEYFHIFFSIIPDVLLSEKGFKSYDALWSRVRTIGQKKQLNYRGVLIDLHRTPLASKELIELGRCLRRIHGISYRWEAANSVPDKLLEDVCTNQEKMGLLSEVRLFIKQLISILDMAEQGEAPAEDLDLKQHVVSSQQEMEQEKVEQLQPSWDK